MHERLKVGQGLKAGRRECGDLGDGRGLRGQHHSQIRLLAQFGDDGGGVGVGRVAVVLDGWIVDGLAGKVCEQPVGFVSESEGQARVGDCWQADTGDGGLGLEFGAEVLLLGRALEGFLPLVG